MSTQHTPGPWRIGDAGCTVFGPKTDAPAPTIVATITRGLANEQQRANARLIAAAPELRDALRGMMRELLDMLRRNAATEAGIPTTAMVRAVEAARAALAKAQGEA